MKKCEDKWKLWESIIFGTFGLFGKWWKNWKFGFQYGKSKKKMNLYLKLKCWEYLEFMTI